MAGRRHRLTGALALACATATPLAAAPINEVAALPEAARVIDIRSEDACVQASLPGARCLPAEWLFEAEGGPIHFPELRWLLGTVALTGAETVAIYPADAPEASAVAALIHLAGQREVVLYGGAETATDRGETRSFSREAVFTAPMRLDALEASANAPAEALTIRLAAFARGQTDTVAFGPAE